MRRIISVFMLIVFLGVLPSMVAAEGDIKVIINEQELELEIAPVIVEGRTLVPMRPLLETLGLEIGWNADTNSAIGILEDLTLEFPIGQDFLLANKTIISIDSEIQLREGTTYVPLGIISELLGYSVEWHQETKTIIVNSQDEVTILDLDSYTNGEKVRVNNASYDELKQIAGINSDIANNIINYREEHGPYPFLKSEDLLNIEGICEEVFLIIKDQITTAFSVTGIASYYGDKFHGRSTASGEKYDKNQLTAAHPYLPFGTYVEVTFLRTEKSTIVRINDRGPFTKSRIIDLSKMASEAIGLKPYGIGEVRMEVLEMN